MTEIVVAALAMLGTVIGSLSGVMAANRLTNYRIEQLEKKVDKHNELLERMVLTEEKVKVFDHRLEGLEKRRVTSLSQ
jgi:Na+/glutamate symporter